MLTKKQAEELREHIKQVVLACDYNEPGPVRRSLMLAAEQWISLHTHSEAPSLLPTQMLPKCRNCHDYLEDENTRMYGSPHYCDDCYKTKEDYESQPEDGR